MSAKIRRRRFRGPSKTLCIKLALPAYQKLLRLSGELSLGWTVERLIESANAITKAETREES